MEDEATPRASSRLAAAKVFWLVCSVAAVAALLGLGFKVWRAYQGRPGVVAALGFQGPSEVVEGRPTRYRVLARDRISGRALEGERVVVRLVDPEHDQVLNQGETDDAGEAVFDVTLPKCRPPARLLAELPRRSQIETLWVSTGLNPVTFVSTDKPQYQPGQTIHVRALTLGNDQRPLTGVDATLEVIDPAGTKVWKELAKTSEFGIVHGDFQLAEEVRLGTYRVAVAFGPFRSEEEVEVKRYVLPKLSARLELDKDLLEPGDELAGTVFATYPFGEPVVSAAVSVTLEGSKEPLVRGVSDAQGRFRFATPRPNLGKDLALRATVQTSEGLSASAQGSAAMPSSLLLEAFPENGRLVPGVENRLWVVTSAAGRPRSAKVQLEPGGISVTTSAEGLAYVAVTPKRGGPTPELSARDAKGLEAKLVMPPGRPARSFGNLRWRVGLTRGLLVRPDEPILSAGRPAIVRVFAPAEAHDEVLLSLWKGDRLLATAHAPLEQGVAKITLELPRGAHGLVRLEAQGSAEGGELCTGQMLALAEPGGGLELKPTLDRASYEPGAKAHLSLDVRRADGSPVRAALGLAAVDEAFFALAEVRPDLEHRFFAIEHDLETRYRLGQSNTELRNHWQTALQSLTPNAPGLLDGTDAALNDARRVALAILSDRFPGEATGGLDFDPEVKRSLVRREQRRLTSWAALAPFWLGGTLLGLFALYGLYCAVRPPGASGLNPQTEDNWHSMARRMGLYWGLALITPAFFAATARDYWAGRGADSDRWFSGGWLLAALVFALLQALQVRRLRRHPALAPHPGYSFSLGLLPPAGLLLNAGVAFTLGFRLDVRKYVVENFDFVLLGAAVLWQLALGLLALMQHGVLKPASPSRRVWLVLSRASLLGLPLSLALAIQQGYEQWKRPHRQHDAYYSYEEEEEHEPGLGARAKGEEGSMGSPGRRYAVAGPRDNGRTTSGGARTRSDFPETLLWVPELVTDAQGKATLEIPLADSITTYRLGLTAVDGDGELGSATLPIRAMQDFFVDVALPAVLTQGDEVSIPVTVYNYVEQPQTVSLGIESDGFEIAAKAEQTLALGPREVRGLRLRLRAQTPGERFVRISAQGTHATDAVLRTAKIEPRGRPVVTIKSGALGGSVTTDVFIPGEAIPGSAELYAKIYGGSFSQLVETLDGAFQRPHGCFEQASSATYPNVLLLAFLRNSGASSPEVERKARAYIEEGYQRLVTFENSSGGFSWFGGEEANVLLTAYGLQEFSDMAKVWPVDGDLLTRTRQWLYAQQQADGGWTTAGQGVASAVSTMLSQRPLERLQTTAYVARALAEAGEKDARLQKALDFVAGAPAAEDAYSLGLRAAALLAGGRRSAADPLVLKLAALAQRQGEQAYWSSDEQSLWYGRGSAYSVEITALAAYVFGVTKSQPELRRHALSYLVAQRQQGGDWASTAATIAALRTILQDSKRVDVGDQTLSVLVAGAPAGEVTIKRGTRDAFRQLGLSRFVKQGSNSIELKSPASTDLAYQLVATHYLPWDTAVSAQTHGPLSIQVRYSALTSRVGTPIDCEVEVTWKQDQPRPMGMVEFAIPPGFELETDALEQAVKNREISSYSRERGKVTVYVAEFSARTPLHVRYRLRSLYPVRALAPAATAYSYYEPELRAETRPMPLTAM